MANDIKEIVSKDDIQTAVVGEDSLHGMNTEKVSLGADENSATSDDINSAICEQIGLNEIDYFSSKITYLNIDNKDTCTTTTNTEQAVLTGIDNISDDMENIKQTRQNQKKLFTECNNEQVYSYAELTHSKEPPISKEKLHP